MRDFFFSRPGRAQVGVALFALAVAGLFAAAVAVSLRDAQDYQGARARLVASLAEEGMARSFESIETTLLAVGAMAQQAAASGHWDLMGPAITAAMRPTPYLRQVAVLDASGGILAESTYSQVGREVDMALLGIDTAVPRGGLRLSSLRIGGEMPGRILPLRDAPPSNPQRSSIPVMITVGSGLRVVGVINPSHLRGLLSTSGLGPSSSVQLIRLDGRPIMAGTDDDRSILNGKTLSLPVSATPEGSSGQFRVRCDSGVEEGTVAYHVSSRYPFAVIAAVSDQDGINEWLRGSGLLLSWGAVSLAALLGGGGILLHEVMRRIGLEDQIRLLGLTRTVFAHSSEAMLITDKDDRILAANPTFAILTGYHPSLLSGTSPADYVDPVGKDNNHLGMDWGVHWRLRCRDGSHRDVTVARAPLGSTTTIVTFNDISERIANERRLRDALEQAELASRAKSEFLAAMSHELRTPLNAILGFSELIRDDRSSRITPEMCREYAADIHDSGSHLRDIVNDLLDLARIEAGKLSLQPEYLNVGEELATCVRLVQERAAHHGLSLDMRLAGVEPVLFADRRALRQILFNLLSNAIKFTPPGGQVTVRAWSGPDEWVMIEVADTGIGIDPSLHDTIFNAYERTPNVDVRRIEGSGLGLTLVRAMMGQHGGYVRLTSAQGAGSRFTLVFPPAPNAAVVPAGPSDGRPP